MFVPPERSLRTPCPPRASYPISTQDIKEKGLKKKTSKKKKKKAKSKPKDDL
jgi:hypothetical protein